MRYLTSIASVLGVAVIIVLASLTAFAHQTRVMPIELEILAKSIGCEPLYDHYDLAVNNAPPFVYYDYNPFLADRFGDVAAFLCVKTEKAGYSLNLVLAKFTQYYPSNTDKEGLVSFGPREGKTISVLEVQKAPSRNELVATGLELWPQRPILFKGFMRWADHEWLGDVEGSTKYTPIAIVNEYGTYPVFYYSPKHGWLFFVTD